MGGFRQGLENKSNTYCTEWESIEIPTEAFKEDIYKPTAKMNAFRMKAKNVMKWMQVFHIRYFTQFGARDDFHCQWKYVENENNEVDEIFIQITKLNEEENVKLFTIKTYLNTYIVMIQGNRYFYWCKKEFPHLKEIVNDAVSDDEETTCADNILENEETAVKEIYFDRPVIVPTGIQCENEIKKVDQTSSHGPSEIDKKLEKHSNTFEKKIESISESVQSVYGTLQKLEGQYCDILTIHNDLKTMKNENQKCESRIVDLERKLEI